jgi:hypothetical protein
MCSFTILITTPNAEMVKLHDRMPVILERLSLLGRSAAGPQDLRHDP